MAANRFHCLWPAGANVRQQARNRGHIPNSKLQAIDRDLIKLKLEEAELSDLQVLGESHVLAADDCINQIQALMLAEYVEDVTVFDMESRAMYLPQT